MGVTIGGAQELPMFYVVRYHSWQYSGKACGVMNQTELSLWPHTIFIFWVKVFMYKTEN